MKRGCLACAAAGALCLAAAAPSRGALILIDTPAGSTQAGAPVSARATVTTGANSVSVFLENLTVDAPSAGQCLSGFQFHLSTNQSAGSLVFSSGRDRSVADGGTYSDGSTMVPMGWDLNTAGTDLMLDLLSAKTAPTHQIIGPPDISTGKYTSNPSVTNRPHNPHTGLSATFDLSVPGVTDATIVTSADFQFDTSYGKTVAGQISSVVIPEPTAAALLTAAAMIGTLAPRRRTRPRLP